MAQKEGNELFALTTIVEKDDVWNRRFHRMEFYRNGKIHVIEGADLPDHIRLETNFRRSHGNVTKFVEKQKKPRPWTAIDTAIALSLLNLAMWIISMI